MLNIKKLNEQGKFISGITYENSPTYDNTTWVRIWGTRTTDLLGKELLLEFNMPKVNMRELVNGKIDNVLRHHVTMTGTNDK